MNSSQTVSNTIFINFNLVMSITIVFLGIVGFVGNLISILVYTRPYMKSAVSLLMGALAFYDSLMCLTGMAVFAPPGFYAYFQSRNILTVICYLLVFVYPLALSAQTASVWTLVVITVERYIAVTYPLKG